MLTRIESADYSTVLEENQYVILESIHNSANKVMLVRTEDRHFFIFGRAWRIRGSAPEYDYREEIDDIMGDSMNSWACNYEHNDASIGEILDWLYDDNNEVSYGSLKLAGRELPTAPEEESFILKGYTEDNIYTGLRGYHSSHSATMNLPTSGLKDGAYRIGIELEVEAKTEALRRKINKARSNWFFQETDGSLRDGRGIEFVTIPLLPKDARSEKTWEKLVEFLNDKAVSWKSDRCGLHVHIGREAFGKNEAEQQATLGKLLFFYYEYLKPTDWNTKIFGRYRTYSESSFDCAQAKAVKTLGMDLMKDKKIRDKVDKGLKDTAKRTRYFDINIQNEKTIEFRKGKGSICVGRITSIVTYCDLMVKYVKKTAWDKLSEEGFLAYIRKNASKSSALLRHIPMDSEEA